MGSILDQARKDSLRILTQGGFEIDLKISNPLGVEIATVKGIHSSHTLKIDAEGNSFNSRTIRVVIHEKHLNDSEIQTRNQKGKFSLRDYFVSFQNIESIWKKYRVVEYFPSETLQIVSLILEEND